MFCVSHHHDGCPWRLVIDIELRQVLLVILVILYRLCLVVDIPLGAMFFISTKCQKFKHFFFCLKFDLNGKLGPIFQVSRESITFFFDITVSFVPVPKRQKFTVVLEDTRPDVFLEPVSYVFVLVDTCPTG